jgi:hypothetical protein
MSDALIGIAAPPAPQPDTRLPRGSPGEPPASGAAQKARVTKDANARAAPGGSKVGTLRAGTLVDLSECRASWCRMTAVPGIAGSAWVHRSLLQFLPGGVVDVLPAPEPFVREGPATAGSCGVPGGLATVVIPNADVNRLNVRATPGGTVLTTIAKGSQVSVVGECGPERAAGIAAPSGGSGSGWCQIDKPVLGCVSAQYLAFGAAGAGGGMPDAAVGIAGGAEPAIIAAPARSPMASFSGSWQTVVDGVSHSVSLTQNGDDVTGSYSGADGSPGRIAGRARDNVLRFSWSQSDGHQGSGRFTLSADGRSFAGSYSFSANPDEAQGIWNGSRR